MDLSAFLPLTPGGVLFAAMAVVAGAPLFARGRRAYLRRQSLRDLAERPLTEDTLGLARVRGRVVLEGPLFAPLSGTPCAGFQLEVRGEGSSIGGTIRDMRPFRLQSGDTSAIVPSEDSDWFTPVTAQREIATGAQVPERLATLLDSNNDVRWLRERGVVLHVVERALEAGRVVSVVGVTQHERVTVFEEDVELLATGTDGGGFQGPRLVPGPPLDTYELRFGTDDTFDRVQVFADPPDAKVPQPAPWTDLLLIVGPAISLAGLLYLARAAEPLLSRMR
jgi:hypothetical protein